MNIQAQMAKAMRKVAAALKPDAPGGVPMQVEAALSMTARDKVSNLLNYRHFNQELNLCYMDNGGGGVDVGFMLAIQPLNVAGMDAESQIEATIKALPPGSVIQYGKLVTPQVEGYINTWANARLQKNDNPILRQVATQRREFLLATATGPSMLPAGDRLHPRMTQFYVSARVPFKGDLSDDKDIGSFLKELVALRGTITGALQSTGIGAEVLDEENVKLLLREMINPHVEPTERVQTQSRGVPLNQDIVTPNTRLSVMDDGRIGFSNGMGEPPVVVTALTVDRAAPTLTLPKMAITLGDPKSRVERITCPYWAYTTVHVLHKDDARDELVKKLGLLNKQTMTESAWFKAMMSELFERKDRANALLKETGKSHILVRAYTGINLYTPPEEARRQTEYVKGLFSNGDFVVSEERFISLPAFLASLPLQYSPAIDEPNRGLQRAWLMSSLNAASMVHIQGDWRGTDPTKGGLMLVARTGQVATFDLLETSINYNFVIVATSGSGKSFLANEIVGDFLSKGGIARIIDVGRSYHRFCEMMGGENIVFSPDNPVSLNPFTGIRTLDDLNEMIPMLKDLLRLMAFPLQSEEHTPAYQYQLLEKAITEAWGEYGEACELWHVVEWLRNYSADGTTRAQDLALQLEPFSHGRYKKWFTGPRTVNFSNKFIVIELEELKQDSALQAVVLQLMMYQVTKEMYMSPRSLPKLLAIDEAWDLMGGLKTGRFIETAFRRIRKYNGIAGVITQSFEDFEKSDAARACIENAAWQFILYQRAESLDYAVQNKRISADPGMVDLIRSVKSGPGYSEVFVRAENGSGLYRFVTDRHSYYAFTSKAKDITALDDIVKTGKTMSEAIDEMSQRDYQAMWAGEFEVDYEDEEVEWARQQAERAAREGMRLTA